MTTFRLLAAALAAGLGLLLAAAPASAAAAGPAYVRLAHLSPDTPSVDVYVASVADPAKSFVVPAVSYGALSAYQPLGSGSYVVSMRPAGAPATSPPVITTTVEARPGGAYTIAGLGMSAELALSVLTDRLDMPAPGRASVRMINAAASVPTVDCGPANQPSWARDVKFGTSTNYADVALGTWDLQVSNAGKKVASLPVELKENSVYTVLMVDRGGKIVGELHRDSAGAGTVPLGGVETGQGGAAADPMVVLAGTLAAAVAGGVLVSRVAAGRGGRARAQ